MRIVAVNSDLDPAWRAMGHEVHTVSITRAGIYSVGTLLESLTFTPDLFFQKEHLGARVLFNDLETLDCIKAFWSIDTHLNYYWQRWYAKLFDVFFTPHAAYLSSLSPDWLPAAMVRLPVAGRERSFTPHTARGRNLSFIGRLSGSRPTRRNFCAVLEERYGLKALDGLSYADMQDIYGDTRVLPNESIAMETNFRLLEGASNGCCVVSPDIGDDQDALLTPGKEVLVYHDALECLHVINECLARPEMAEAVGIAARKRILAEHLHTHRAASVLLACGGIARNAVTGSHATDCFAMSLCLLHLTDAAHLAHIDHFVATAFQEAGLSLTARLMLAVRRQDHDAARLCLEEAEPFLSKLPADGATASAQELAALCGGYALWRNNVEQSRAFYMCHERLRERRVSLPGASHTDVSTAWIRAMVEDGKPICHGWQYREGCCRSALEFILQLAAAFPDSPDWAEQLHAVPTLRHTLPHLDMTALARLSLNESGAFEASLDYVQGALRCFDLKTAKQELDLARQQARNQHIEIQANKIVTLRFPYNALLDAHLGIFVK